MEIHHLENTHPTKVVVNYSIVFTRCGTHVFYCAKKNMCGHALVTESHSQLFAWQENYSISGVSFRPASLIEWDKDPLYQGSYRPISLLNVDSKLYPKILVTYLEKVLPVIISQAPAAFIKEKFRFGRTIMSLFHHNCSHWLAFRLILLGQHIILYNEAQDRNNPHSSIICTLHWATGLCVTITVQLQWMTCF